MCVCASRALGILGDTRPSREVTDGRYQLGSQVLTALLPATNNTQSLSISAFVLIRDAGMAACLRSHGGGRGGCLERLTAAVC